MDVKMEEAKELLKIARALTAGKIEAWARVMRNNAGQEFVNFLWEDDDEPYATTAELKKRISTFERTVNRMAKAMDIKPEQMEMTRNGLRASAGPRFLVKYKNFDEEAKKAGFKISRW